YGGSALREIISAGESLQLSAEIRQFFARLEHCELHNHYGPTESHVVTAHVLSGDTRSWPREVPIGKPIANTQIYLLDQQQNPVSAGVVGEIWIGGESLANGYVNQPTLTAEKFVSNPNSKYVESRLYRTGDVGRWMNDGSLECLGRCDGQIKVRGFRIEPVEIELALLGIVEIAQAVVMLQKDEFGAQRLTAYCIPHNSGGLDISFIRHTLTETLPDYMVPSIYVELETLPLTKTGKVDRRALPVVESQRPDTESGYVAATTEEQEKLVEIWQELLSTKRIGVEDDFFELGGNSLLAMRLLAVADKRLKITCSVREFYQNPTIAGLIQSNQTTAFATPEVLLIHEPDLCDATKPPLVVAPSLFGHVHDEINLFSEFDLDRPVYGLNLAGDTPYWTEKPSIEEIAKRLIEALDERLSVQSIHLLGYSFGGQVAYEIGQQLERRGRKPASVILVDCHPVHDSSPLRFWDLWSIVCNVPRWLVNELRVYGVRDLIRRLLSRLENRQEKSDDANDDPKEATERYAERAMHQMFDMSKYSTLYQKRVVQSYMAFISYRMRRTNNHVVYLKSRIRNLIHRHSPEENWNKLVNDGKLDVVTIPGDHGKPFYKRWRKEFFQILQEALTRMEQREKVEG
ncbi:MAG: AMP-binding protein, partial [Planctomycetaceae bacterium]|nr:AMP-binding protein [Planctomycetaceae bacterium]